MSRLTNDFREIPIVRKRIHTGKLEGDDEGYRLVTVHECDRENPDPLVVLDPEKFLLWPVYARGPLKGVTHLYTEGLGSDPRMLVRAPVERALIDTDQRLHPYGSRLLIVDAWRSAKVQAAGWRYIFEMLVSRAGLDPRQLSYRQILEFGRRADDTFSFYAIRKDDRYYGWVMRLARSAKWDEVEVAARALGITTDQVMDELSTFLGNYDTALFTPDMKATNAHGGASAVDAMLVDRNTGKPRNVGVHFDSTSRCAMIDFFERPDALEEYKVEVAADANLRRYLDELEIGEITPDVIEDIRGNRREQYWATRESGATIYSREDGGENWHFNFGNERGGRQRDIFLGAGSGCHSLLKDVRDPATGEWVAVWGNAAAHKMAAELLRTA